MVIHLVHCQTLLDIGGEVARAASKRALSVVVLAMSIQVPLVRRPEVAQLTLYHRHRVVFHVLCKARLHMRNVCALRAPEELGLDVFLFAVLCQLLLAASGETAQGAL